MVQVADELHVGEDGGVARVVEDGAVVDGDDETRGLAGVEGLAAILDAGRVARFSEGEGDVGVWCEPPMFMPMPCSGLTPFECSQPINSTMPMAMGPCFFATGTASAM